MKFSEMIIGVPTEIMPGEHRVSATPETVKKMVAEGAKVLVQKGAGEGAFFSDAQYREAGADLVDREDEIFEKADVILKVKEPLFNEKLGKHESDMLREGQYLITFLHPAAPVNHKSMEKLRDTGAISLTLDGIPRISRAQAMDALTSMSTVAGYKGVLMAANKLAKFLPMTGTAVGVIQPAKVVVIGTGVAGLQAVATAKRLGAMVTAVDIRPDAIEYAKSAGAQKALDPGVPPEIAIGEGGYAQRLPDEWLKKEREFLKPIIKDADIVILTALIPGKEAPVLITDDMVKSMAPGSVIIDIAIDQGGNCSVTKAGEEIDYNGVTVSGVKNIPGNMPTSSTWMFANNIYNLLAYLAKDGKIVLDREDPIVKSSLTTIDKKIVHAGANEVGLH